MVLFILELFHCLVHSTLSLKVSYYFKQTDIDCIKLTPQSEHFVDLINSHLLTFVHYLNMLKYAFY